MAHSESNNSRGRKRLLSPSKHDTQPPSKKQRVDNHSAQSVNKNTKQHNSSIKHWNDENTKQPDTQKQNQAKIDDAYDDCSDDDDENFEDTSTRINSNIIDSQDDSSAFDDDSEYQYNQTILTTPQKPHNQLYTSKTPDTSVYTSKSRSKTPDKCNKNIPVKRSYDTDNTNNGFQHKSPHNNNRFESANNNTLQTTVIHDTDKKTSCLTRNLLVIGLTVVIIFAITIAWYCNVNNNDNGLNSVSTITSSNTLIFIDEIKKELNRDYIQSVDVVQWSQHWDALKLTQLNTLIDLVDISCDHDEFDEELLKWFKEQFNALEKINALSSDEWKRTFYRNGSGFVRVGVISIKQ
eukprot:14374_1